MQAIALQARADADGQSLQCAGHVQFAPLEVEEAVPADGDHAIRVGVLDGAQHLVVADGAGPVALHGRLQAQCLVRTLAVVARAPGIERALHSSDVCEVPPGQHLHVQRAVEPLQFAVGLRMVRSAEAHSHALADQPDRQLAEAVPAGLRRAPGRAVVGVDAQRQPVALERLDELIAHSGRVGARQRVQAKVEARVVVQQRERMATPGQRGEVALEVDLPQTVRSFVLEALPGPGGVAGRGTDQVVPMQDARDGAGRHASLAKVRQAPGDLAAAPGGVLATNGQHGLLDGIATASGAAQRAATAVMQHLDIALSEFKAAEPLVAGLGADAEPATQRTHVGAVLAGQVHEFFTQGHGALLRPDHGLLPGLLNPESVTHVLAHPLPMSPVYTAPQKKVTRPPGRTPGNAASKRTPGKSIQPKTPPHPKINCNDPCNA